MLPASGPGVAPQEPLVKVQNIVQYLRPQSNCPNEVVNVSFLNFCVIHQEILALVLLLYFVVIIF